MTMPRSVGAETLDLLPHDDPAAQGSRRDLKRIHSVMGSANILMAELRRVLPAAPPRPLRLSEIGCGDATLLLAIARAAGDPWRGTSLLLLDRQPLVAPATIAAFAAAGWRAETRVGDVFGWAADTVRGQRCDAVIANLFLHHFEGDALGRVLAGCARHGNALVACEPRRSGFALAASRFVGLIGANAVTREDAVLSVKAGFAARDLSEAWQACRIAGDWRLDEHDAGLFSHCFCASRGDRT